MWGGGGLGNSGNARKKTFFFQLRSSLNQFIQLNSQVYRKCQSDGHKQERNQIVFNIVLIFKNDNENNMLSLFLRDDEFEFFSTSKTDILTSYVCFRDKF